MKNSIIQKFVIYNQSENTHLHVERRYKNINKIRLMIKEN